MARHEELVEEIRRFLDSTNQMRSAQAEELAQEYAHACISANNRLRQSADLLRRGLRSEAIHLAEMEPNLLDLVASLDMDEAAAWREICASYEWAEAPALAINFASALNEAYAEEEPLTALSSHLRVMALARAPLNERLIVMRKLAEKDAANTFWDDDIRTFEHARIDEIRASIPASVRSQDFAAVGRFASEVKSDGWRVAVPKDLQRSVDDAHRRLCHAKADGDLRQMLPGLLKAYSEMDFEACESELQKWQTVTATANCTPAADLQEQVDPIIAWLNDEQQRREHKVAFDAACDTLEQAIDTDQPTPELERVYQATLRFQHELPSELEERYRSRLTTRETAGKQRRRLLFAGIGAAFVAVAGTVGFFAYQATLNHELADALQVIHGAQEDVSKGSLKSAIELRKQLVDQHQRIAHDPQMIKALADFENAASAESQRETNFSTHMQAAESAGVEKPALDDLNQADTLALTSAETQRVAALKEALKEASDKTRRENDKRFVADGSSLSDAISAKLSRSMLTQDPTAYESNLKTLTTAADELEHRSGVTLSLQKAQIESLRVQLSQKQQLADDNVMASRLLDDVRNSGKSVSAHTAALKAYLDASHDGAEAQDFAKAAESADQEQGVESWATMYRPWLDSPIPGTVDEAKLRVVQIQDYLKANPKSPLLPQINAYLSYLNQGVTLVSDDGPWKKDFGKLLSNPLVHDLFCLEAKDGTVFYVTEHVHVEPGTLNGVVNNESFPAITSPDLDHPTTIPLSASNLLKSITPAPSPQFQFARAAQRLFADMDFTNWSSTGFQLIESVRQQRSMSPVLQAILLQRILDINKPVAALVQRPEYDKAAAALTAKDADDLAWMDPQHPVPADTLQDLKQIAASLPSYNSVVNVLRDRQSKIVNGCKLQLLGEGVLLRSADADRSNSWSLNSDGSALPGSVACQVDSMGLVQVGTFTDGKWQFDESKLAFTPSGKLEFIFAPHAS